jgi:hypothetical protein
MSLNLAKNVDIQQIDDSHAARRASVDEDRNTFPAGCWETNDSSDTFACAALRG